MKQNKNKTDLKLGRIIIIMCITAIISGLTSGVIVYSSYSKNTGISYKTINGDDALKEFLEVYDNVSNNYYQEVDRKSMLKEAISAMLKYLGDNYTTYMSKEETNTLDESLAGQYWGIGVVIQGRNIVKVLDKSPALSAGILAGDEIIKVNNEDVTNKESNEIVKMIKGGNNEVSVTVLRDGKEISLTMQLSKLNIPAISAEIIEGTNIGYIGLGIFSSTVAEQVKEQLDKFKESNINGLIIDLRGNSGGYLSAATDISNMFIEQGKPIYSLETKSGKSTIKDTTKDKLDYKVVVLIDNGTASASEILAAALKDSYGAVLVGVKSFGKGKVQQTVRLSDGSMAKYTTAKWYTPNDVCIDGVGISPDYEVELELQKDSNGKVTNIIDTQLNKAVELLK